MLLFYLYIFVVGLVLGSFYNVCIYRLESGEPIVRGRSHCQDCRHPLHWHDLIPVFSYLWLRGRCRYCGKPISFRYPLVELITGGLFVITLTFFGCQWETIVILVIVSTLVITAFIDWDTMLIRDRLIILLGLCGLVLLALHPDSLTDRFIGAACISILFLIIAVLTNGLGFGDVKLMAVSGLILGWQANVLAMLIGVVSASVFAVIQMAAGRKGRKDEMPLGPFLILGILVALFIGQPLILWYLGLL